MNKYAILTVIYQDNPKLIDLTNKAFAGFPENVEIYAVINKMLEEPKIKFNKLVNGENCLSSAWNLGLDTIFKNYDYAVVTGLDSITPSKNEIESLVDLLEANPSFGLVSATHIGAGSPPYIRPKIVDVTHGDGSFSFYVLSKQCFRKVGKFDENFKPAYFEDNDYLERLKLNKYTPKRSEKITYLHLVQGTMKHSPEIKLKYNEFMQHNLDYYISKWGNPPAHLPKNIKFI